MKLSSRQGPMILVATLTCWLLAGGAALAAQSCDAEGPEPGVRVDFIDGRAAINHRRTVEDIGRLGGPLHFPPGSNRRRIGLTKTSFDLGTSGSIHLRPRAGGRGYCVTVESVTLSAGFSEIIIYIPRHYRPSSCAYREILAHERQHVAIHRRTFDQYKPAFRRAAERAVDRLGAFVAEDKADAQAIIGKALRRGMQPVMDDFHSDLRRANMALDTPAEYQSVQSRCTDW